MQVLVPFDTLCSGHCLYPGRGVLLLLVLLLFVLVLLVVCGGAPSTGAGCAGAGCAGAGSVVCVVGVVLFFVPLLFYNIYCGSSQYDSRLCSYRYDRAFGLASWALMYISFFNNGLPSLPELFHCTLVSCPVNRSPAGGSRLSSDQRGRQSEQNKVAGTELG